METQVTFSIEIQCLAEQSDLKLAPCTTCASCGLYAWAILLCCGYRSQGPQMQAGPGTLNPLFLGKTNLLQDVLWVLNTVG